MLLLDQVTQALKTIKDPLSNQDIVTKGLAQGIQVSTEGKVTFILDINTEYMNEGHNIKEKANKLLRSISGVKDVNIILTAQKTSKAHNPSKQGIPGIKHIIAVASGKGGVGKSTTAVNLACGLQTLGLQVGILDADIYGPSLPKLLGTKEKPKSDDGKSIHPIIVQGLKCMSIGFMTDETSAVIWRGPMVQAAFTQMLRQVHWGELDVLVIDLPPGTGDVQLSLAQNVLLTGAIIVSTPQDLAFMDARRSLEMFHKVSIPVLGFVENMSYFLCPHCQSRSEIFEHGGVHKHAKTLGFPLLAEIPLHMSIRETSEQGNPIVLSQPLSAEANVYKRLAHTIWDSIAI